MTTLEALGWRGDALGTTPRPGPGEVLGRVAVEHRGAYVVLTGAGEFWAEPAGRLRHEALGGRVTVWPAVGDWVICLAPVGAGRATIRSVLPRRGVFQRKEAGRGVDSQVVAANVDVAFLVTSFGADLNPRRIERYVAMAYEGGVAPVVVVTKADLAPDEPALADACGVAAGAAVGVPVHSVSAQSGDGVDALGAYFDDGRTVALLGSSGVGKSTLINRLLGQDAQRVSEVRGDGKGRHTTTHRELIPRPGGGLLVDTPGLRELAVWGGEAGIHEAFPEVDDLAARCRFRDCSHTSEPGCAVLAAVRDGAVPVERLESFAKLAAESRYLDKKLDTAARLERKRRDKALNRALYRRLDEKGR